MAIQARDALIRKDLTDFIGGITARIVGRRIPRLLGNAVVKLPTGRNVAQQWSLKS